MSNILQVLGTGLVMTLGVLCVQQNAAQEKPAETPPAATAAAATKKENPVKATPEVLAAAKKIFGYDCAMCHGSNGDGKGELVESMKLKMKDWHQADALDGISDGDIFDLIVKGKDKMIGEGDRLAPAKVWGLVHYVRSFPKKSST
jgi:mono/diheme cytochrome c family protein